MLLRFIHNITFAPLLAPVVQLVSSDFLRQDIKVVNLPSPIGALYCPCVVVRIKWEGLGDLCACDAFTVSQRSNLSSNGTPELLTIGFAIEPVLAVRSRQVFAL